MDPSHENPWEATLQVVEEPGEGLVYELTLIRDAPRTVTDVLRTNDPEAIFAIKRCFDNFSPTVTIPVTLPIDVANALSNGHTGSVYTDQALRSLKEALA